MHTRPTEVIRHGEKENIGYLKKYVCIDLEREERIIDQWVPGIREL